MKGASDISKPLFSLPSTIQELTNKEESWNMIKIGVNPLEKGKLLNNLGTVSTKERAKKTRKKVTSSLSPDSLYRSVKILPKTLQYDYERRHITKEASKSNLINNNLLSDGRSTSNDENS